MNNLQEIGASLVTTERQRDYGHPYHDFTRIAGMLSALGYEFRKSDGTYRPLNARDFPIIMNCVKLSRQVENHKWDNIVDIHGYMTCLEQVIQYELGLNEPTYSSPPTYGKSGAPEASGAPAVPVDEDKETLDHSDEGVVQNLALKGLCSLEAWRAFRKSAKDPNTALFDFVKANHIPLAAVWVAAS